MIFKLLNPTTALAIGTISDYNLHSAYHNMHLHVHLTDYLLFPLLLQRTFLVLQNVWQVMFLRFTDKTFWETISADCDDSDLHFWHIIHFVLHSADTAAPLYFLIFLMFFIFNICFLHLLFKPAVLPSVLLQISDGNVLTFQPVKCACYLCFFMRQQPFVGRS